MAEQYINASDLQAIRAEMREMKRELSDQMKDADDKNAGNIKDAQIGLARLERDIGTGMVSKEFLELKLSNISMAINASAKETQTNGQKLTEIQNEQREYQREQREAKEKEITRQETLKEKEETKHIQQNDRKWSKRDKFVAWFFASIATVLSVGGFVLALLNYLASHH